jgi:lipoate-protein ligase A
VFLDDGSKVVGISQRRTRRHARFQCAVSLAWDPIRLLELLNEPKPDLVEVLNAGSSLAVERAQLVARATESVIARLTS